MEKETIRKQFDAYAEKFDSSNAKISLKIFHTYKVAEITEEICRSLGLSEEDTMIAWTIGMLHDFARFEQVKQFDTFRDAVSFDHADYCVKLLFEDGLIVPFNIEEKYHSLISKAIMHHNKYRIPSGLTERELLFCKIIRDADKIDIIRANYETPMEDHYKVSTAELKAFSITPAVYEAFFEEKAIKHEIKVTPMDMVCGHASLCFELEFPVSRKILLEQGYLQKYLSFESDNADTKEKLGKIRSYLMNYLGRA